MPRMPEEMAGTEEYPSLAIPKRIHFPVELPGAHHRTLPSAVRIVPMPAVATFFQLVWVPLATRKTALLISFAQERRQPFVGLLVIVTSTCDDAPSSVARIGDETCALNFMISFATMS
ncbi:hypothetical protein AVEN_154590-1 [Araneus ventricosus]|uniref:Uncharacterized protein n=1 Tax=Araneus ventricosus TaxID=182803 RepID=A0A4Y2FP73_ARAVE|nr:hypothetical protein AVEN_154590-1 [Araneus ventricosus]